VLEQIAEHVGRGAGDLDGSPFPARHRLRSHVEHRSDVDRAQTRDLAHEPELAARSHTAHGKLLGDRALLTLHLGQVEQRLAALSAALAMCSDLDAVSLDVPLPGSNGAGSSAARALHGSPR